MKAIVLTANGIRHGYFVDMVANNFNLVGIVTQPKKQYYDKNIYSSSLVKKHFKKLQVAEIKWLGSDKVKDSVKKYDEYETDDINSKKTLKWALDKKPEIVFLFGTKILGPIWMKSFGDIVNLHLGLSPYYRGSATLFWPFVNKELHCIGVTIHLAVENVDAGPILKRIKPNIEVGDNYYDINYKTIKVGIDGMADTVKSYIRGEIDPLSQKTMQKGKLYRKKEFNEIVLKQALDYVSNGITERQILMLKEKSRCNCLQ